MTHNGFMRNLFPFEIDEVPQSSVEVAVVGSGVAGLQAALHLANEYAVRVYTKSKARDSNTWLAQGGIAAALGEGDSPEEHLMDTLRAGAGLCERSAVKCLVEEGPEVVEEIISSSNAFNRENGQLSLGREGGHGRNRVAHARGDATGREIESILLRKARNHARITLEQDLPLVDILSEDKILKGLVFLREGQPEVVRARGVVIATGGLGQIYRETTNHSVVTGDGMAAALRAGLTLRDLEFVQFHPTVLYFAGAPRFLLTEALRGEGAKIRDLNGQQFLGKIHPDAELAPRDVVSRGILKRMIQNDSPYVFLDVTHMSRAALQERFPTVTETCGRYGLEISSEYIPIRPCAHYSMGGVRASISGESELTNLFFLGEVASTGVHGANRLASNSLLEGLVAGSRVGRVVCERRLPELQSLRSSVEGRGQQKSEEIDFVDLRKSLQSLLWRNVGIIRTKEKLSYARDEIKRWLELAAGTTFRSREAVETVNMLQLGRCLVETALKREESRGAHYRSDFPEPDPGKPRHSLVSLVADSGELIVDWEARGE